MAKVRRDNFKISVSHYKILVTVDELNKMNKYPTAQGINNILQGKLDSETRIYIDLKTFGTLISFQGRKLCAYVSNMVKRDYLAYVYDKDTDNMYLRITNKGIATIQSFARYHKITLVKKESHRKPQIVELL